MLFPLLSTLKLALLLQQQVPATTELAPVSRDGIGTELERENATFLSSTMAPSLKGGCWRTGSSAENSYNLFHADCCPLSIPSMPVPFSSTSASSPIQQKCRLSVDFAELLNCFSQQELLAWDRSSLPQECLAEMGHKLGGIDGLAEMGISIGNWSGDSLATSELFNGLHSLANVHSLELSSPNANAISSATLQIPNVGLFFPQLRQLSIHSSSIQSHSRPSLLGRTFLRDLSVLKSLKVVNVDFWMDSGEEPQWLDHLERLHVENASLGELPRWMAKCTKLERIFLLNCSLNSALALSQLPGAVQIKMRDNRIGDLHRMAFKCGRLLELDMRRNSIVRIAPHTLRQCHSLRLLDLSENPFGAFIPDKAFLGCQRLKELRLERIGLSHLRPEMFIGLASLKSLRLGGNALSRVDPFTFLPTRSIRSLSLANCSLATIPLALTQCCLLNSLSLDDNRLAGRLSMPPEVLALLGRLSHFSFQRNPLLQLPRGLFLYEPVGEVAESKLADMLTTLIQSPVWRLEPCTPFLWHFHLRNASSPELRRRVASWGEARMLQQGLGHCKQLYETIMEGIAMYRELLENSGCEATRRLRSVRAKENCPSMGRRVEGEKGKKVPVPTDFPGPKAGIVQFLLAPASVLSPPSKPNLPHRPFLPPPTSPPTSTVPSSSPSYTVHENFGILHLSLGANFFLLAMAILLAAVKMGEIVGEEGGGRKRPKRREFEEIC